MAPLPYVEACRYSIFIVTPLPGSSSGSSVRGSNRTVGGRGRRVTLGWVRTRPAAPATLAAYRPASRAVSCAAGRCQPGGTARLRGGSGRSGWGSRYPGPCPFTSGQHLLFVVGNDVG